MKIPTRLIRRHSSFPRDLQSANHKIKSLLDIDFNLSDHSYLDVLSTTQFASSPTSDFIVQGLSHIDEVTAPFAQSGLSDFNLQDHKNHPLAAATDICIEEPIVIEKQSCDPLDYLDEAFSSLFNSDNLSVDPMVDPLDSFEDAFSNLYGN